MALCLGTEVQAGSCPRLLASGRCPCTQAPHRNLRFLSKRDVRSCFCLHAGHGHPQGLLRSQNQQLWAALVSCSRPCPSRALFLLRLNGDSYIRQTQKHVDVNERLLPERKRVMGLPWAALAWCVAVEQDSWAVSSGLAIVQICWIASVELFGAVCHPWEREERSVQDLGGKLSKLSASDPLPYSLRRVSLGLRDSGFVA